MSEYEYYLGKFTVNLFFLGFFALQICHLLLSLFKIYYWADEDRINHSSTVDEFSVGKVSFSNYLQHMHLFIVYITRARELYHY